MALAHSHSGKKCQLLKNAWIEKKWGNTFSLWRKKKKKDTIFPPVLIAKKFLSRRSVCTPVNDYFLSHPRKGEVVGWWESESDAVPEMKEPVLSTGGEHPRKTFAASVLSDAAHLHHKVHCLSLGVAGQGWITLHNEFASCRALCPLCQGLTLYSPEKLTYFLWVGGVSLSCVKHTFWTRIAPHRHGEIKPVHLSCRNTEMKVLVRAELILWDTRYVFDAF